MDSEKRWIRKIKKSGNHSAANSLISKYYREMYAFVYKQTLDEELSLDLTQEIFIHVLKSIRNYDSNKASFRTWLYKLASHRLIDYYRSKSHKYKELTTSIDDYEFEAEQDMTISLEYREDVERVIALVNELDVSTQQIVRLKLFGEYTFWEIALLESLPESTVKTKYYTALRRIRTRMKEGGYYG